MKWVASRLDRVDPHGKKTIGIEPREGEAEVETWGQAKENGGGEEGMFGDRRLEGRRGM